MNKDDPTNAETGGYAQLGRRSLRTHITSAEHLQVMGLLLIAQRHNKALAEVEGALRGILQETEGGEVLSGLGGGWIGDAIYGGIELADADELLRHLGLTVRDENDGE